MEKINGKVVRNSLLLITMIVVIIVIVLAALKEISFKEFRDYFKIHTSVPRETIFTITNKKYHLTHTEAYDVEIDGEMIHQDECYNLFSYKYPYAIIVSIQKYKIDKEKEKIYFIAFDEFNYFILNYNTDELLSYSTLDEIDEEDRIIFEDTSEWKTPDLEFVIHN